MHLILRLHVFELMQQITNFLDAIPLNCRVRIIKEVWLLIVEELDSVGWSVSTSLLLNHDDILVGAVGVFVKLVPRLHVQWEQSYGLLHDDWSRLGICQLYATAVHDVLLDDVRCTLPWCVGKYARLFLLLPVDGTDQLFRIPDWFLNLDPLFECTSWHVNDQNKTWKRQNRPHLHFHGVYQWLDRVCVNGDVRIVLLLK